MSHVTKPLAGGSNPQQRQPSSQGLKSHFRLWRRPFRFLDLPHGVRRVIYGYLLLDPIDGIEPQYTGSMRVYVLCPWFALSFSVPYPKP